MADVGIKRVFWTDASGKWQRGMVRDLLDDITKLGSNELSDDFAAPCNVFVTGKEIEMIQGIKQKC